MDGTTYYVIASHTYADEGSFMPSVIIADESGNGTQIPDMATVTDPAVVSSGPTTITPAAGSSFSGAVATFLDPGGAEALANYSSLMLLQSQDPLQFRAVMGKYREDLLEKNKEGLPLMNAGPVTFGARLSSSHFPAGYEAISYGRGTWLFHMLRSMMRDAETTPGSRRRGAAETHSAEEPFIRSLRTVRERYEGKSITTRELLRVFEEQLPPSLWYEGKKSLDWFYQSWINGTAIPKIELQAVKYAEKTGSTTITGTVLQKSIPNELVTSVPVYAVIAGKTLLIGRVFADGPETQFHLTAPSGTRKIILDPNQTLLTRVH